MTRRRFVAGGAMTLAALFVTRGRPAGASPGTADPPPGDLSESDWRELLDPAQYAILRENGTEPPFSSALLDEHRPGVFACAGCDLDLFSSTTKFDSGTGWPSFWAPLRDAVGTTEDQSFGMERSAVHCSRCGGHLGHVFEDGPAPTGLRYCINGLVLAFEPAPADVNER